VHPQEERVVIFTRRGTVGGWEWLCRERGLKRSSTLWRKRQCTPGEIPGYAWFSFHTSRRSSDGFTVNGRRMREFREFRPMRLYLAVPQSVCWQTTAKNGIRTPCKQGITLH